MLKNISKINLNFSLLYIDSPLSVINWFKFSKINSFFIFIFIFEKNPQSRTISQKINDCLLFFFIVICVQHCCTTVSRYVCDESHNTRKFRCWSRPRCSHVYRIVVRERGISWNAKCQTTNWSRNYEIQGLLVFFFEWFLFLFVNFFYFFVFDRPIWLLWGEVQKIISVSIEMLVVKICLF